MKNPAIVAVMVVTSLTLGLVTGYGLGFRVLERPKPEPTPIQRHATGIASWYDYELNGKDKYSQRFATCASRDYPKGTMLTIINVKNNKQVTVRVNDYIEHVGRVIDLSSHAFKKIADLKEGVIPIKIIEKVK